MLVSNSAIRQIIEIGALAGENSDAMDELANFIEIANNTDVGIYMVHNSHIDIKQSTVTYTFDSGLAIIYTLDKGVSVHIGELIADITDYDIAPEYNYLHEFCRYSADLIEQHYRYVFLSI